MVGLSRTIVAKIESGIQPATPTQLNDFAKLFGVSIDYLVTGISTENTTVADDLGLTQTSIEQLKKMNTSSIVDGKETRNDTGKNRLYALNMLLTLQDGLNVLDSICRYLLTDFDNAWFYNESIDYDEDGKPLHFYHETNKIPIRYLNFDNAVKPDQGVTIPVRFLSDAILQDISDSIKQMRSIAAAAHIPVDERMKQEQEEIEHTSIEYLKNKADD